MFLDLKKCKFYNLIVQIFYPVKLKYSSQFENEQGEMGDRFLV